MHSNIKYIYMMLRRSNNPTIRRPGVRIDRVGDKSIGEFKLLLCIKRTLRRRMGESENIRMRGEGGCVYSPPRNKFRRFRFSD